ncbi:MAG: CooT family nickel-binding protein [Planctomycetota bacterium]|nr:CooT family nickel-binding protein [Planctomycetota bacterium]
MLESVGIIKPEDDKILMRNIFGEEKSINARIKEINLMAHKIVLDLPTPEK